ncbi:MAG TPA: heavy metal translocating P-type ATPase [Acidimicrobiales bacterium]|nr:heavy metal translocating P-type ATPase [Acidimicrobiales bacterium]
MNSVAAALRRMLLPLAAGALVAGAALALADQSDLADAVWTAATGAVAIDLVVVTASRLREGRVAVDLVALVALVGSLLLDEALAGAVLALMVASGDALEQYAHRRAQRSLAGLLSMAPKSAHRLVAGEFETVPVDEIAPDEVVLVKPGEVLPVDGLVLDVALLDESVLTGESRSVERDVGESVRSGSLNAGGAFRMRAAASAEDSSYAGIVGLVKSAGVERTPLVRLADRYAMVFVPVVFATAGGAWLLTGDAVRALAVLVVATPCPLVLAAPVAVVSGIASAARSGVVVKDGAALEGLAQTRTVLMDKTGTLTVGRAHIVAVVTAPRWDTGQVLSLAASVEQASPHVLAATLVREALHRGLELTEPHDVTERPGSGVGGVAGGHQVWVGSISALAPEDREAWLAAAERRARREGCSTIVVIIDGEPAGLVLFTDELRTDAPRALRALRRAGVDRVVMVTGDRIEVAEPIGSSLGIDQVFADRTPQEKLDVVRSEAHDRPGIAVMVGDGVNDAPALAAADLGVAMGARGATASSEAADVVLVVDRLDLLASGVVIAKRARSIARESVLLGMGLSFLGMGFAAAGLLQPVGGAVAQEVIDVLAITNALRALRLPRSQRNRGAVPDEWQHQLASGHGPMRLVLEDVRSVALALDTTDPAEALRSLQQVARRITEEIVPHERDDESQIYPMVAERLGGDDPLASMSRTHHEIFHLASLLGRLVDDATLHEFDEDDRSEARRLLYALDAVLRLHFAQEEELLFSMTAHERAV